MLTIVTNSALTVTARKAKLAVIPGVADLSSDPEEFVEDATKLVTNVLTQYVRSMIVGMTCTCASDYVVKNKGNIELIQVAFKNARYIEPQFMSPRGYVVIDREIIKLTPYTMPHGTKPMLFFMPVPARGASLSPLAIAKVADKLFAAGIDPRDYNSCMAYLSDNYDLCVYVDYIVDADASQWYMWAEFSNYKIRMSAMELFTTFNTPNPFKG